jgi:hypothetical protein
MNARRKTRRTLLRVLGTFALAAFPLMVADSSAANATKISGGAAPAGALCIDWEPSTSKDCPSVQEIETAISGMLGHPLASRGLCDTQMTGAFRPDAAGGWRVDLHFASHTGETLGDRSLEIRDAACSALKDPLSLVIVLMVEGSSAAASTAVQLPGPPSPDPVVTSAGNMTALSVGGAVSSGLLPGVGFGVGVGVASRAVGGVPLRLDTTFWFPTAETTSGPSGQFWAWLGAVGLCPSLLRTRRLGISTCLRAVAGAVRGIGLALEHQEGATRPFAAGELSAVALVRVSRQASIYLSAGLAAPWVRPRFVYRDIDDTPVAIHQPKVLIPLAGLGIELGSGEARQGSATP